MLVYHFNSLGCNLRMNRTENEVMQNEKKGILVGANYTFYSQCCAYTQQLTRTKQQQQQRRRRCRRRNKKTSSNNGIKQMKKVYIRNEEN